MFKPKLLLLISITIFFCSCDTKVTYNYAIRDFSETLQPYLTSIVSEDYIQRDTAFKYLYKNASEKELEMLSHSEHPVLRAAALRIMTERNDFEHFDVLMSHLNDTSHFHFDYGEFGIGFTTVTDDLITRFEFKSLDEKNKAIDSVITKHNYLRSAYNVLPELKAKPQYYSYIKQMAQKEWPYLDTEKALYALSKYKKKEDIPFIKEKLLRNTYCCSYLSFLLIEESKDPLYFEVLKKYYYGYLLIDLKKDYSGDRPRSFFNALASYKNQESEALLSSLLNSHFFSSYASDSQFIKIDLVEAIWKNKCTAYSSLISKVAPIETEIEKNSLPLDPYVPTGPIIYRW